jgi:hypothetical protein
MAAPAPRVSMTQATAVAGTLVLVATLLVAVGPAAASPTARTSPTGYRLLAGDGGVFAFTSPFLGSAASDPTRCPTNPPGRTMPEGSCWSMAATMDGGGYYVLNAATGRIFTYGDAVSYGQPANTPPYQAGAEFAPNAVAIALTADGLGYWVLEEGLSGLGSVQAFGDAASLGDEVSAHVVHNGFPVGIVGSSDGKGYVIVDSDGGVFAFGDAVFAGSMGGTHLNAPVIGLAATPDGNGYWLAAADGGVFSFGDAVYGGSMGGVHLLAPVIAITADPTGPGYWLAATDGGVFALGGAPFLGSMGGRSLAQPIVAITT